MATVKFLIAGLVGVARVVATAENEGRSIPSSLEERGELGTAAFESWVAQPKLHYVPCFECLLDDCNEKKRYGTTERIYTKCWWIIMANRYSDWYETVDGCYIDSGDISYPPNSNTALRDRDAAVRPVCDYDKPLRKPNITTPHTPKRNDNTITPLSQRDQPANPQTHQAALEPATVTSRYPLKCHQGSDPLWAVARTYAPQSNISISCWTTASMNASELLSYPSYEPTWLLTAQNCYVPKNEVTLAPNRFAYLSYCPSPRHYWAEIRNPRLARECPVGCRTSGFDFFLADFECWYKGDEVQGDTMWYRGWEVDYLGAWWTIWWPRAAVGRWGASGEPLEQCSPDKTVVKEPYHRPTEEKREKQEKAVGRAEPRAVMNVYALVNDSAPTTKSINPATLETLCVSATGVKLLEAIFGSDPSSQLAAIYPAPM
ncbi:hypothetical protein B0J11DRAFT_593880 [Dendryphion nanum]|uniref:Uncharacterized protein n=1 Tax=Dendryphion nanum TaxID=256645 RepID=A0A9P9IDQ7_9PLEO|nr:hypothetical protein B0J11DRAFT_593880 [Dendryphion nanum]